jgi:putative ABC transport system permease protein
VFQRSFSAGEAIVNTHLADRLLLEEGDEFLLRIHNPGSVSHDMVWTADSQASLARRFTVKYRVPDEEFGGFNLKADQVAPYTVFVPLDFLGKEMGREGNCNVLLVAEKPEDSVSPDVVNRAFRESWTLSDAGFTLAPVPDGSQIELTSDRIFLDHAVVTETLREYPDSRLFFSYFVNEIRLKEKTTPYSFVSAFSDPGLGEDEVLINEWLARDLNARKGDRISLAYYVPGDLRSRNEQTSGFQIKDIVPMRGIYADRNLTPRFPGLSDAENCRSWDMGALIDLDKIRDRDEEYWEDYRGTPKVFLSLRTAQKLWRNRYGELTAIRFPGEKAEAVEKELTASIEPSTLGYFFRNVKREGLAASAQSVSFDQLFLGLSFFIIAAALLLTGLLFAFTIEHRSGEIGSLLALGFPKRHIGNLFLAEGMILAVGGSIPGVLCGIGYHQGILLALKSVWRDIVGTSSLHLHVRGSTILLAMLIGIAVNFFTILIVTWNRLRQPSASLQKGTVQAESFPARKPVLSLVTSGACFTGAVILLAAAFTGATESMAAPFFAVGAMLLAGGIAFAKYVLTVFPSKFRNSPLSIGKIGLRNAARRRYRSLAVIGLLACGVFIVFTVGMNRRSVARDAESRASGTGGFALMGEVSIPLLYDLNSMEGRDAYAVSNPDAGEVRFVSFRVREGDDASCLNLNRVAAPPLIGVSPAELSSRKAFSFLTMTGEVNPENPWEALEKDLSGAVIPGVADQTVITWGLGKAVGDTLQYRDERGQVFGVKLVGGLANSIFQGNIIVSEKALVRKFPTISGFRLFLADAPLREREDLSRRLEWALRDHGIEVEKTEERLAEFNKIENTYLSIFLILGTFGLILGSIGIGMVMGRNVSERRGELALLQAVGFPKASVRKMLVAEHSVLLGAGLGIGMVSALAAVLPALLTPGSSIPFRSMVALPAFLVASGGFWIYTASILAMKGELLPSLRDE